MNRPLQLVALTAALSLGMPSGVALAAPQSATATAQSSSAGQAVSDTWITTKVKADLATTEGIKSTDISVETVNGVVTLIGVLDSRTAVDKAIAVAKGIKGVVDVDASALKAK